MFKQVKIDENTLTEIFVFKPLEGKEVEFKGFKEEQPDLKVVGGFGAIKRATLEIQEICDEVL